MDDSKLPNRSRIKFSLLRSSLYLPFGTYQKGKRYVSPLNQTLVGREGERGYLLKLLRQPSERSAILITGRRGSGKSSFVNSCIYDFDYDVASRWERGEPHFSIVNKMLLGSVAVFLFLIPSLLFFIQSWFVLDSVSYPDNIFYIPIIWASIFGCIANFFLFIWSHSTLKSKGIHETIWAEMHPNYSVSKSAKENAAESLERTLGKKIRIILDLLRASSFIAFCCFIVPLLVFSPFFALGYDLPNSARAISVITLICGCLQLAAIRIDLSISMKLRDELVSLWRRSIDGLEHRKISAYSNMTISGRVIRYYYPIFKVTVNLGFDRLEHNHVVHAMLSSLRTEMLNPIKEGISFPRLITSYCLAATTSFLVMFILPPYALKVMGEGQFIAIFHIMVLAILFFANRALRFFERKSIKVDKIDAFLAQLTTSEKRSRRKGSSSTFGFSGLAKSGNYQTSVSNERDSPVDPRLVELQIIQLLREIRKGFATSSFLPGNLKKLRKPYLIFVFDELDKLGFTESNEQADLNAIEKASSEEAFSQTRGRKRTSMRAESINLLLSDMKNLISTAPARYIFIGGPELHDLWLADETAREPFFTSIFDSHIHLPSLLTDRPNSEKKLNLTMRIREFIAFQYRRAYYLQNIAPSATQLGEESLYPRSDGVKYFQKNGDGRAKPHEDFRFKLSRKNVLVKRFDLRPDLDSPEATFPCIYSDAKARGRCIDSWKDNLWMNIERGINSIDGEMSSEKEIQHKAAWFFLKQAIGYLTFRSGGNPKKLVALFDDIIRQTSKFPDAACFGCESVMKFGDTEIYRIQLLNSIFIHLARHFTIDIGRRDDKLGPSMFYH